MEIRITNDAASHIALHCIPQEPGESEVHFFDLWGVHIFEHRRRIYLILTEGRSYFSVIVLASNVRGRLPFEEFIRDSISSALSGLFEGHVPGYLLPSDIVYSKTKNDGLRRVQSDQIWRAKVLIDSGKNTFEVNRVPYKSLGFRFPVDQLIQGISEKMKDNNDYRVFVPFEASRN